MAYDTHVFTHAGGRGVNMDYCGYAVEGALGCWALADGLGGHRRSEVAARLAVESVLEGFRRHPAVTAEAAKALVLAAHEAVLQGKAGDPELSRIATTLVVLLSDGRRALWAHVGDSRLYHVRAGAVAFQTLDHSASQSKAEQGEIPNDAIRGDRDRSALFQAVGNPGRVWPTVVDEPRELCDGDAFLLCVDGFWEKVYEPEIEIDRVKADGAAEWLRLMEQRVTGRMKGDDDNYTALTVIVRDPSLPPPAPGRRFVQPGRAAARREGGALVPAIATGVLALVGVGLAAFLALGRLPVLPPALPADAVPAALPAGSGCESAWRAVEASRNRADYDRFVGSFGGCPEVAEAGRRASEIDDWAGTDKTSREALRTFSARHPRGLFAAAAQCHVDRLEALQASEGARAFAGTPAFRDAEARLRDGLARLEAGRFAEASAELRAAVKGFRVAASGPRAPASGRPRAKGQGAGRKR
jgi:serine/threonine protein phosphatase PrpC